MSLDDDDNDESVAEIERLARAVLGRRRTAELHAALAERSAQFARVTRALPSGTDRHRARAVPGEPTPASTEAGRRCRQRIARLDAELRAFARLAPERPGRPPDSGASDGTLDGFAVGVKDVIDLAGMPTRSGSPLTAPDPVGEDSVVVARLRRAGAAIVGKTQCTEWALNDPAPTLNPWDGTRTPGGSSAGSAVAVACGMCTATLDTQTAGDVLRPAAYNGVVGLKPTIGWAPLDGVQPVASTIDTIGVTARDVRSAALVASAIADAPDRVVAGTRPTPLRVGVVNDSFVVDEATAPTRAMVTGVVDRLADAGAVVHDVRPPVDLGLVHAAHRILTFAECSAHHLPRYPTAASGYGPRARELLDLGRATPARAYVAAQLVRHDAATALATMFGDVDIVVLPVTPGSPPLRDTTGDSALQIPWTLCGFPSLSLPCGVQAGLPAAVQLVGAPNHDPALLAAAEWCEAVLDVQLRPPR